MKEIHKLNYKLEDLPRELKQFYISASESEIKNMLGELNLESMSELYAGIPEEVKMSHNKSVPPLTYEQNLDHLLTLQKIIILNHLSLGTHFVLIVHLN